ncbi:hypothetical protein D1825_07525 [Cellulomonas rhizosphaerae]|uniref:Polymerase nucleotidyl transferase domain-containing protein n=1 Tax=Cellulomonas rhizosphaerae TaxID=2293719 RepID=A0A413RMH7_9CELL|nr:hypothetical protein D1825_07525 [Cellulomonas rhizosphaerae]
MPRSCPRRVPISPSCPRKTDARTRCAPRLARVKTISAELLGLANGFVADRFPSAVGAVLAGSSAAGTSTSTSDLDLVVLCPEESFDGEDASLAATYEHASRLVEVFAYTPDAYRRWAGRELAAHRPVILAMLTEGVILRSGSELVELRAWADGVLAAGPTIEPHALDQRRYSVSALLDDLTDAEDPGERALLLAEAFRALSELLLVAHGCWLGSGKWLLRRLRAWDGSVADRLTEAFVAGHAVAFVRMADELLAPLGGRLQAGMVR